MKIREFYNQIGQDYEVVLERMMGSEAFTAMLLQSFMKDDTFEHLKETIQDGRPEEIFHQAHTLKGLAANLGLKPVYDKTSVLVEITRRGQREGVKEAFSQIETAYDQTIASLKSVEFAEVA